MHTANARYLKSHLMRSVAVLIAAAASIGAAQAQTQTIATPPNVNAISLLNPFTTLLGTATINQNFTNAISINNNSTAAQRAQSIVDNTITTDNGVVLSDALGSKMSAIWNNVNSQAANGTTTTFSNNLLQLFRQINAVSQDDSGKAKNWLADGSANGSVFVNNNNLALGKAANSNTPITNAALPPGGTFNVYDKAYNPPDATRNLTGNSRPYQASPGSIAAFSAPNYFGVVQSNFDIAGGVNGNVGTGLFANASAPSGHTTFGYTTSLLFAMLVPERYSQFMTRASEYGNSRVVLGVHYPLDVILGRSLATYDVVQMLNNNPQYTNFTVNGVFGIGDVTTTGNFQTLFVAAQTDVRNLLQAGCGSSIATCSATSAPDRFSNMAQNQADYIARLTYGLPTLSFAQAPREQAPAGGPDASILLATLYGGSTTAARTIAPNGGMLGSLQTSTINQILVNTETNAFAAFYGTPLSYWSRLDLFSASIYFQNVTGVLTLASSDRLTTNVTVGGAGTFGGTGLVVGNTVVTSGGTLAPGIPNAPGLVSTPGTLTIQGNLQFNPGSLYAVQFAPGATSLTNVTGTTGIAPGSQATAFFAPGIYTVGSRVPVLTTAANGLSGQFGSLAFNSAGINVAPQLSYDGQDVFLTLKQAPLPIVPAGTPTNGLNVAGALSSFILAGGTLPASLQNLYPLSLSPAAYAATLNQLAGQTTTAARTDVGVTMNNFLTTMFDFSRPGRQEVGAPMAFAPEAQPTPEVALAYAAVTPKGTMATKAPPYAYEPRWSTWASGFGGTTRLDGDATVGSQKLSANLAGGVAGLDYRMSPDTTVGVALSGGETHFSLDNAFGSGNTDFFQGGIYGKQRYWNAYVAGALAFATHHVTSDRTVTVGPASEHLTSTFNASSVAGRFEGGYRFGGPVYGVTPYTAVQVQSVFTPGYTEAAAVGAGGTAQTFASSSATSTRTELGSWVDTQVNVVMFRGRAAWLHEFNRDASISATFAAFPSPSFVVTGAQHPGDAALISGLFELPVFANVTFSGRADAELSSHATTWSGMGIVRYVW
jgi:subtilase-type serine protease